jgi:hypothetical protein
MSIIIILIKVRSFYKGKKYVCLIPSLDLGFPLAILKILQYDKINSAQGLGRTRTPRICARQQEE